MSGINANATFYLTVVDANTTCSFTDSVQVNVYNYQTQFPVISENAGVLSCTPAHFYQWYLDSVPIANGLQQTYTPTAEGFYSVAVYDSAVCNYYTSAGFNYLFTSISNNKSIDELIEIFPNPSHDFIFLKPSFYLENANLRIIDVLGNTIFTDKLSTQHAINESYRINMQQFVNGIYFIIVQSHSKEYILKTVKN
jgi:hypothetical protein